MKGKIAEVSKDEDQIRYFQYDDYVTHLKFNNQYLV